MRSWYAQNPEWCADLTVRDDGTVHYQRWIYCDKNYPPTDDETCTWEDYLAGKASFNLGGSVDTRQITAYIHELLARR